MVFVEYFYNILKVFVFIFVAQTVYATENFTIAVASNFLLPLNVLKQEFEAENNVSIKVVSASTSKLYAQIKHGAPFDIFLSADHETVNLLVKEGLVISSNVFIYTRGQLAFWKPNSKDAKYEFEHEAATKLVIANPKLAPYGMAAWEVLNKTGELSQYKDKLVYAENISQAFQYVYHRNVEAGFVAFSQLKTQQIDSGFWLVPDDLYQPIDQYGTLLNRSVNRDMPVMFIKFLTNEKTQKRLVSEFGYKALKDKQESSH